MNRKFIDVTRNILAVVVIFQMAISPIAVLAFDKEGTVDAEKGETSLPDDGRINPDTSKGETDPSEEGTDPTIEDKGTVDPEVPDESKDQPEEGGSSSGSRVEVDIPTKDGPADPSCDAGNLIVNGSFEDTSVTNAANWDIFPSGTPGLGWDVAWNGSFAGAPLAANMEIQNGVNGWNAYEGNQYIELDSDWGGPSDPMSGEQASSIVSQTINTVPGNTYSLHFAFAARPGTMADDNKLGIYIDDGVFDISTVSAFGEDYSDQTYWIVRDFEFKAYNEHTKIAFADIGTPNSMGSFLDDIQVTCVHEGGNDCPADKMIYARVKLTPQPYGWRNWGNGNTSGKIFVGGNTDTPHASGGNTYLTNEWFPLTNPDGTFINDAEMVAADYADVPGIALERHEGQVRIVLYGYLYGDQTSTDGRIAPASGPSLATKKTTPNPHYYLDNRELSQGSLEFSTDMSTRSTTVIPTSQASDPVHPMDHTPGVHQYHPESDSMRIISNLSQWHMVVTSGADGFYTYYTTGQDDNGGKDCPTDDGKTGSLIVNKVIQGQGNGTFHFNGPEGVFDITTSGGEGVYTINGLDGGTYSVIEQDMAGWDVVSSTCGSVQVAEDNAAECTIVNKLDTDNPGCDTESKDCPGEGSCDSGAIWARVNVEAIDNLGTGDVTSNVYLGSDSNVIASGQWFMVYDGTNYINDPAIEGYEDVKGLAVQRMNGKLRMVLHGSDVPTPNHKEYVQGNIEFFNALVAGVSNDASGNNTLENGSNGALDVISFAGDRSYFELQVDEADDGFFTNYTFSRDENCDNGGGDNNVPPTITAPETVCILTDMTQQTYNFLKDVTTADADGDTLTVYFSHDIVFGAEGGPFTINYTVYDTSNASSTDTTIVNVKSNCDNNGDDDNGDDDDSTGDDDNGSGDDDNGDDDDNGGGGNSSGSRGHGSSGGEVLGASTGCAAFTEYHKTGDVGGEIPALQTFLNAYMNSGLNVNGVYDTATTQAVHDFQAFHWNEIINPWNPPLSPNTTGREYKTTRMTINFIMECPETEVYLEDPKMMYEVTEVKDKKDFDPSEVASLLDTEHGVVSEK